MEIPHEEAQRLGLHYGSECVVVLFLFQAEDGVRLGCKSANAGDLSPSMTGAFDDAAMAAFAAMSEKLGMGAPAPPS